MSEEFKARRYACLTWPFLRLGGGIKFEAGFFTARTPEHVSLIEGSDSFGKHIHPIKWEPTALPVKQGKVEELIEAEIADALAERQPKARRGGIGTR